MKKKLFKRISTSIYTLYLALTVAVTTTDSVMSFTDNYCIEIKSSDEYDAPPIIIKTDDQPNNDY